jgi:transcriptional regulator of acetoin/glycerol metabolism
VRSALLSPRPSQRPPATPPSGDQRADDEPLKEQLVAALSTHQGNVSEVAREMGKTRMQIHRWMKRFGIDPEDHRKK